MQAYEAKGGDAAGLQPASGAPRAACTREWAQKTAAKRGTSLATSQAISAAPTPRRACPRSRKLASRPSTSGAPSRPVDRRCKSRNALGIQQGGAAGGLGRASYRWYEAGLGRYSGPDPIGVVSRGTISPSGSDQAVRQIYGYAEMNPILRFDPLGLKSRVCCKKIPIVGLFGFRHCYIETQTDKGRSTCGLFGGPGSGEPRGTGRIYPNTEFDTGASVAIGTRAARRISAWSIRPAATATRASTVLAKARTATPSPGPSPASAIWNRPTWWVGRRQAGVIRRRQHGRGLGTSPWRPSRCGANCRESLPGDC